MEEEWRPIPGWEGIYDVSNLGRVRGLRRKSPKNAGGVMTPNINGQGYHSVLLRNIKEKRQIRYMIHRVVCIVFNGEPPSEIHHADHIDNNKNNNCSNNVQWLLPAENQRKKSSDGVMPWGSRNHLAVLTEDKVIQIRQRLSEGREQKLVAVEFDVCPATISHIHNRRSWKHI